MRRTGFKPKAMWKRLKRSKPINKIGPKTKAWNNARAQIKIEFEHVYGITTCELRYKNCFRDNFLGFAHAAKRRKLTHADLKHVILICGPCHDAIEFLPPKEMKRIVDETIRNRAAVAASLV